MKTVLIAGLLILAAESGPDTPGSHCVHSPVLGDYCLSPGSSGGSYNRREERMRPQDAPRGYHWERAQ